MATSPVWNDITLLDLNGNILSFGQIFIYAGGSWTIQASAPVTLDINGTTGGALTLPSGSFVNLKLTDTNGNLIAVRERIIGIDAPSAPGGNTTCGTEPLTPTLTWTASSGPLPIANYQVWRSTDPVTGFTSIATVANTVLTYVDTSAVEGTTYYYYITAEDTLHQMSIPSVTHSCTASVPGAWTLVYDFTPSGNSNGSSFQSIVSDNVGSIAYASTGEPTNNALSTDGGATWTLNETYPGAFNGPVFFNGTYFVTLDDESTFIYFTTDCETWTTDSVSTGSFNMVQDPTTQAIYLNDSSATSPNTILYRIAPNSNTVTKILNNVAGPNLGMSESPQVLTAGGLTLSSFGAFPLYQMWSSTDSGVTWTISPTSFGTENIFIGLGYNGTSWLLITANAAVAGFPTQSWISSDGINWTNSASTTVGPPYQGGIAVFDGLFYSSQGPSIASSPDGVTWTTVTNPFPDGSFGLVAGSRLYLLSPDGIAESTDGITLTPTNVTSYANNLVTNSAVTLASGINFSSGSSATIYKRNPA